MVSNRPLKTWQVSCSFQLMLNNRHCLLLFRTFSLNRLRGQTSCNQSFISNNVSQCVSVDEKHYLKAFDCIKVLFQGKG